MEVTVERLQQDMEHVIARMATIEKLVTLTSKHDKVIPPQVTTQFLCSKNKFDLNRFKIKLLKAVVSIGAFLAFYVVFTPLEDIPNIP